MADARQTPFRGLVDMFAEMSRMREHITHADAPVDARSHVTEWVPLVDILAEGVDIVIRCEMAGVTRDEISLSLTHGQLEISGTRRGGPQEERDVSYYVRERRYGPFRRTIGLSEEIQADRVSASYADGLLEIRLIGCARASQHEQIEISGASAEPVRVGVANRVG